MNTLNEKDVDRISALLTNLVCFLSKTTISAISDIKERENLDNGFIAFSTLGTIATFMGQVIVSIFDIDAPLDMKYKFVDDISAKTKEYLLLKVKEHKYEH